MFKNILEVAFLFFALQANSAVAKDEVVCGGRENNVERAVENKFISAKKLIDESLLKKLNERQQEEALKLLQDASRSGCARARVVLANLIMERIAALSVCSKSKSKWCKDERKKNIDKKIASLYSEVFTLLKESVLVGEGKYEFSLLLIDKPTEHYSSAYGRKLMREASSDGDIRATEYLYQALSFGQNGFSTDLDEAERLQKLLSGNP